MNTKTQCSIEYHITTLILTIFRKILIALCEFVNVNQKFVIAVGGKIYTFKPCKSYESAITHILKELPPNFYQHKTTFINCNLLLLLFCMWLCAGVLFWISSAVSCYMTFVYSITLQLSVHFIESGEHNLWGWQRNCHALFNVYRLDFSLTNAFLVAKHSITNFL